MAKRSGRNRKAGKRTKSGQLSRAGAIVRPSEWVQAQQARFGNHYGSALGRAYAGGLLGEGNEAKTRLDAGNKFVLRYSKVIGGDCYTCPLDRSVKGSNDNPDHERDLHQQEWLYAMIDSLDHAGLRPWLDQLIHTNYTDRGPYWLDALLGGQRDIGDRRVLEAAIMALDLVAGQKTQSCAKRLDAMRDIGYARS